MQDFKFEFGYDNLFTVDPVGRGGGLTLFYMENSAVDIIFSNDRIIDIKAQIDGHEVFITFIYRDPMVEYRENVWKRLLRMSTNRIGA